MKSAAPGSFYLPADTNGVTGAARGPATAPGAPDRRRESFLSTAATAGPWSDRAQHGGPPAALLARALERLEDGDRVLGRFTMDLLGPVPVGPVSVTAAVLRPGRTVSLREAVLYDDQRGRPVARAQAWAFPASRAGAPPSGATAEAPPAHAPADGHLEDPPAHWCRGYLDSVEWRWIEGAVTRPGPAVVWMRPLLRLIPGEDMSPWQRLLCCVDSASGVSAALDPAEWNFLNTELTVHVTRPPAGPWVCLEAETVIGPGSVGVASSRVSDDRGRVGHSHQALLVARR